MASPTPVLDLLFPRRCPVCDRPVKPFGALICRECEKVPHPVGECVCCKCGKPVSPEEEYCADCRKIRHLYDRGAASFLYRSVSGSLYRFKYDGRREYADFYGREMARTLDRFLQELGPEHRPDMLIPVPCSADRKRLQPGGAPGPEAGPKHADSGAGGPFGAHQRHESDATHERFRAPK